MNKLHISLASLVGVIGLVWGSSTPTITASAALAAPASWDYAYKYNATNDEFEFVRYDASASNTPVYTRTVDSTYYNYTYTGNGNDTLPFEVTLTFNRSNTSWKSYGGGYTSDDTKIGSDASVGSITNKFYIYVNNNTNMDYMMYFDISSSGSFIDTTLLINNMYYVVNSGSVAFYIPTTNALRYFLIPAFSTIALSAYVTSATRYIDALYFDNIGTSPAYTAGVEDTESDIQTLINEAYLNGYQEALDMQTADALTNGASIFIGLILMLFLTFVGIGKRIFILNLLAIAGTIFFAVSSGGSVPLIILSVGFVLFNIYAIYNGIKE